MESLNKKMISILEDESLSPSSRFWKIDYLLKEQKRCAGVQLTFNKSLLDCQLADLIQCGAVRREELSSFSEELQKEVDAVLRFRTGE
ncbi:MAG: hypothetical protein KBS81_02765 [Spirochaetales bacterium]|nr:hypothetical protein [Candidatus Physcosoma equi]